MKAQPWAFSVLERGRTPGLLGSSVSQGSIPHAISIVTNASCLPTLREPKEFVGGRKFWSLNKQLQK